MLFCFLVGYDSDDECEENGGVRYTRRNKGKKYAPLRHDDSLEHGAAGKVRDLGGFGSNGASASANGRAVASVSHVSNHELNAQPRYSSEENVSDGEQPGLVSYVRQQPGGIYAYVQISRCCLVNLFMCIPNELASALSSQLFFLALFAAFYSRNAFIYTQLCFSH